MLIEIWLDRHRFDLSVNGVKITAKGCCVELMKARQANTVHSVIGEIIIPE